MNWLYLTGEASGLWPKHIFLSFSLFRLLFQSWPFEKFLFKDLFSSSGWDGVCFSPHLGCQNTKQLFQMLSVKRFFFFFFLGEKILLPQRVCEKCAGSLNSLSFWQLPVVDGILVSQSAIQPAPPHCKCRVLTNEAGESQPHLLGKLTRPLWLLQTVAQAQVLLVSNHQETHSDAL